MQKKCFSLAEAEEILPDVKKLLKRLLEMQKGKT